MKLTQEQIQALKDARATVHKAMDILSKDAGWMSTDHHITRLLKFAAEEIGNTIGESI